MTYISGTARTNTTPQLNY